MDIKFEEFTFTPHMAQAFYEKSKATNNIQRDTNQAHVRFLAGEMVAGRWKSTPTSPIGITEEGFVFDGYHRLLAIVHAKVNVCLFVAFNATAESFDVIDRGHRRSDLQVAKMSGSDRSSSEFSAILRAYQSPDATYLKNPKIRQGEDCTSLLGYFKAEADIAFSRFPGSQVYLFQNFRAALIRACKVYPAKKDLIKDFLKLAVTGEKSSADGYITDTQAVIALYMNQHLSRCPGNSELSRANLYRMTLKGVYCFLKDRKYSTYRYFIDSKLDITGFFNLPTDDLTHLTITEAINKVTNKS